MYQEVHRLQKDTDEANKRALVLERDNKKSERQLADMSEQVSHILLDTELLMHIAHTTGQNCTLRTKMDFSL